MACTSFAAVTSIDVTERSDDGGYERIVGKVHFAVDRVLQPNRVIADIDLAPRNPQGLSLIHIFQAEARRLHLQRILFGSVAQLTQVRMAEERVVVKGQLGVEREQAAIRAADERIDLHLSLIHI